MSSSFNHPTITPPSQLDTVIINSKSNILPPINEENYKFPSLSQYSTQSNGSPQRASPPYNITLPSIDKITSAIDSERRLSLPSIHSLPLPQPESPPTHPYSCSVPECQWKFKRHEHLKRHMTTHTKQRPYQCHIEGCLKSFSRSDNFSVHMRTHSTSTTPPAPYPEHTLQYARRGSLPNFTPHPPSSLVLPSQRMTSKGQYYSELAPAGQPYPPVSYLANGQIHPHQYAPPPQSHLTTPPPSSTSMSYRSANGPKLPQASVTNGTTPGGKPLKVHQCCVPGCGMKFRRAEHLKRHGRVHTMERPFSCTFPGCLKTFSRSDNLHQHERIHLKKGYRGSKMIPIQPVAAAQAKRSPSPARASVADEPKVKVESARS